MDPATMAMLAQAIPAIAGAGMSMFGKKNKAQTHQLSTQNPQQQQMMSFLGPLLQQGFQNPEAGFEPIAQQARQDFQRKTLPSISNQFGGLGALRSSGFQSANQDAGMQLDTNLAAQRAQFGNQRLSALSGILGQFMQPSYQNMFQPESQGTMQIMGNQMFGQGLAGLGQQFGIQEMGRQQRKTASQSIAAWQKGQQGKTNQPPQQVQPGSPVKPIQPQQPGNQSQQSGNQSQLLPPAATSGWTHWLNSLSGTDPYGFSGRADPAGDIGREQNYQSQQPGHIPPWSYLLGGLNPYKSPIR